LGGGEERFTITATYDTGALAGTVTGTRDLVVFRE